MPPTRHARYGKLVDHAARDRPRTAPKALPPEEVADAIVHALTARRPRTRYVIGRDANPAALAPRPAGRAMDRLLAAASIQDC